MGTPRGWFLGLIGFFLVIAPSTAYAGLNSVVTEGYYATESQYTGMDPNDTFFVELYGGSSDDDGEEITRDSMVIVYWLDGDGNVKKISEPLALKDVVQIHDGSIDRITFSNNFLVDQFELQGSGQATLTEVAPPTVPHP